MLPRYRYEDENSVGGSEAESKEDRTEDKNSNQIDINQRLSQYM